MYVFPMQSHVHDLYTFSLIRTNFIRTFKLKLPENYKLRLKYNFIQKFSENLVEEQEENLQDMINIKLLNEYNIICNTLRLLFLVATSFSNFSDFEKIANNIILVSLKLIIFLRM